MQSLEAEQASLAGQSLVVAVASLQDSQAFVQGGTADSPLDIHSDQAVADSFGDNPVVAVQLRHLHLQ
jgi:hypothetical protein